MIREFIDVNVTYNTHMGRRTLGIRRLIDIEVLYRCVLYGSEREREREY